MTVAPGLTASAPISPRDAGGDDEHVGAPAHLGEVPGAGVAGRHRGVPAEQQLGHRLADQRGPADDHGLRACAGDVVLVEQVHDAGRRAGRSPGRPCMRRPAFSVVNPSTSFSAGMRATQLVGVQVRRRRQLQQDPGDRRVGGELVEQGRGRLLVDVAGQVPVLVEHPRLDAEPALVADVDLRRRVVADEHRRQTRRESPRPRAASPRPAPRPRARVARPRCRRSPRAVTRGPRASSCARPRWSGGR